MAREEELGAVYADMNAMVSREYQGRSTQNSKDRDDFDHANEKSIKDVAGEVFRDSSSCPGTGGSPSLQTIQRVCVAESRRLWFCWGGSSPNTCGH